MIRSAVVMGAALLFPSAGFAGDFNGDGFDDLAIGVPLEYLASQIDVGGVNVLYGSASFISVTGDQFLTLTGLGLEVLGAEEFGTALAIGDFNGDGNDDLAIGAPLEALGANGVGADITPRGHASGLTTTNAALWYQETPGVLDVAETGDLFGYALGS
ncbi:MAG: FG-GAP repeat protein [Planctomycetes bacterium]|nr:FG-GAP repeat protein [Planctomycetota bacterium]